MENRYLSLARVIIRHCESRGSEVGCCFNCILRAECNMLLENDIPQEVGVFELAKIIQEWEEAIDVQE